MAEELLGQLIENVAELLRFQPSVDVVVEAAQAVNDETKEAAAGACESAQACAEDAVQSMQDAAAELAAGYAQDDFSYAITTEDTQVAADIAACWDAYDAADRDDVGTEHLTGGEEFGPISVPAKVILQWEPSKPILPLPAQDLTYKAAGFKYCAAAREIIAFATNSDSPVDDDDLHARAQAVLRTAADRLADELRPLKSLAGAIPELKRMSRRMITSASAQAFLHIFWNTLNFILLKYRADAKPSVASDVAAASAKAETDRWLRDLTNVVDVLSDGRRACCNWGTAGELRDNGVQCFDEVSGPYVMHLLNAARMIANKQPVTKNESVFCLLDMHEALVRMSQRIEALFSAKRQLMRCTVDSILERLADRARAVLGDFEKLVSDENSPPTRKWNLLTFGDEIHPLTTAVMDYAASLAGRGPAVDRLLKHEEIKVSGGRSCTSGDAGDEDKVDVDVDEVASPCGHRVRLLILNLLTNLREKKANWYAFAPLGAGFLCRNMRHILEKVRESDKMIQLVGDKWVDKNLEKELLGARIGVATAAGKAIINPTVRLATGGLY